MEQAQSHQQMQWGIKSILQESYAVFVSHLTFMLLFGVTMSLLSIPQFLIQRSEMDLKTPAFFLIRFVVSILFLIFIYGWHRVSVKMVRKQAPTIRDIFPKNFTEITVFAVTMLLLQIITGLGMLALIVPGVYFALKYAFVGYLVVDGLELGQAFGESARITRGVKIKLLTTQIVIGAITLAPLIMTIVFVTFVYSTPTLVVYDLYVRAMGIAFGIFSLFYILIMSVVTTFAQPVIYERLRAAAGLSPATLAQIKKPVMGTVSTSS